MRMCMNGIEPLTLDGMLADPLIRMMMHSDGVSEKDFEALWQRARGAVPLPTELMQCNCAMGG